jgi:transaldolase
MKLFLDTAVVEEIRQANELGVIDGITTNPTLIKRSGRDFGEVIREIASIVDGPISGEVNSLDAKGMIEEGRVIAKIHPNMVVKLPLSDQGLIACKKLTSEGIRTNVTLIFTANQALLAMKAGASFVSPFLGRLDDISHDGMQLIEEIVQLIDNYGFDSEIISASIRHPRHVLDCALAGAHIATIPYKVLLQLLDHPLTEKGIAQFRADYESSLK